MGFLAEYGVAEDVEAVYVQLSVRPGVVSSETMPALEPERVEEAIASAEELGLVERDGEGGWIAVDVSTATARLEERQRTRKKQDADDLRRRIADETKGTGGTVELLRGMPEINRYLWRMTEGVTRFFDAFDLPPYGNVREDPSLMNPERLGQVAPEWAALRRGVQFRAIYHPAGFRDNPVKRAEMDLFIRAGEQARVAEIGTKLMIFDRREAAIAMPSSFDGPPEDVRGLRTNNPIIVEALNTLFQTTWEGAIPWFAPYDRPADVRERIERAELCLIAGMGVKAIARDLEVSDRTMARYLEAIRDKYRVKDDVQLGMKLSRLRTADASVLKRARRRAR